jgi:Protein of unknown function (DUF3616)
VPALSAHVETVVPHGEGVDHAEGIALLAPDPLDPRARLLIVYEVSDSDQVGRRRRRAGSHPA